LKDQEQITSTKMPGKLPGIFLNEYTRPFFPMANNQWLT